MRFARPPLRILIVEDNPADARLLEAVLDETDGDGAVHGACARPQVVGTLAAALAAVQHTPFDVILLDPGLPDATGLSTVRRMRAAAPAAAVVVLSGHDDPASGVEAVAVGAQDALTKGRLDAAQLWRTIGHALERQRAELEIRCLNAALERRVEERTRALLLAGEQLDAFVRSASHDLKAPLRSVAGLIALVADEHGEGLDETGHALLVRAERAVSRMDAVIEALIELSDVKQTALHPVSLDLAPLAGEVSNALLRSRPADAAPVSVAVHGPLPARADERAARKLLHCLLTNALRFTAGRPAARIEFGRIGDETPPVFYVRDDGTGFDMQFADKLFQPFQRLHDRSPEVGAAPQAGVGIGLAVAQRIVRLHGGDIWAESAPDCGACFFFTFGPTGGEWP